MRFEVKAGGLTAIVAGLALLSGGVFVLGLLAGYDVARQSQPDEQKAAADFPLAPPPPAAPSSAATAGHAPGAPAMASGSALAPAEDKRAAAGEPAPASPRATAPQAAARENHPRENRPAPIAAAEAETIRSSAATPGAESIAAARRPPPQASVHKPFNIEIQAAMDSTSAGQMIRRLGALGYQPHTQPTRINGTIWYKVEIGPYATQVQAAAAEIDLRRKYNSTYGHGGAPAQPADTDDNPEE